MCRSYFIWNDTQVVPYGKGVAISLYTKGRFWGANRGDFYSFLSSKCDKNRQEMLQIC